MYFDTAIAGYWRALALPYQETMAALEGDLYVRKATVEYEGSARYDDRCELGVRCARIGKSSMIFSLALFRGQTRLVHGELVYVFADPVSQTSKPVPATLREVLGSFEAERSMIECRTGNWAESAGQARPLRQAVFEEEQGVPQAMAEDAADAVALHAVAINRLGLPVGTGRLLPVAAATGRAGDAEPVSRIGRLAVMASLRGAGVGTALVRALVQAARSRGDRRVVLATQPSAQPFYERLGFAPLGPRFEEAGLAHQEMVLDL
jgi:YbgC/YbaW family acyl-CoA thioester hydrolase